MFDITTVSGIGKYEVAPRGDDQLYSVPEGKVFLVLRPKTLEVRCDHKLSQVLCSDYETVMESRYFGRGGVEIVPSGQLSEAEIADLVRLSYNLTLADRDQDRENSASHAQSQDAPEPPKPGEKAGHEDA